MVNLCDSCIHQRVCIAWGNLVDRLNNNAQPIFEFEVVKCNYYMKSLEPEAKPRTLLYQPKQDDGLCHATLKPAGSKTDHICLLKFKHDGDCICDECKKTFTQIKKEAKQMTKERGER